jgi:hypothetical protein
MKRLLVFSGWYLIKRTKKKVKFHVTQSALFYQSGRLIGGGAARLTTAACISASNADHHACMTIRRSASRWNVGYAIKAATVPGSS